MADRLLEENEMGNRNVRVCLFHPAPRQYLGLICSLNSEGDFPGVNCLCNGDIDNKRCGCEAGIRGGRGILLYRTVRLVGD